MADTLALEGFLVTPDIEKAFDSVNRCVLLQVLRNLDMVKIFLLRLKRC